MRVVCLRPGCGLERHARVVDYGCSCGWTGWTFATEESAARFEIADSAHVDAEVATLALADALGDAGLLGLMVEGAVRLVVAMDILEPPQRFALLGLLDALDPFDAREEEAS